MNAAPRGYDLNSSALEAEMAADFENEIVAV